MTQFNISAVWYPLAAFVVLALVSALMVILRRYPVDFNILRLPPRSHLEPRQRPVFQLMGVALSSPTPTKLMKRILKVNDATTTEGSSGTEIKGGILAKLKTFPSRTLHGYSLVRPRKLFSGRLWGQPSSQLSPSPATLSLDIPPAARYKGHGDVENPGPQPLSPTKPLSYGHFTVEGAGIVPGGVVVWNSTTL